MFGAFARYFAVPSLSAAAKQPIVLSYADRVWKQDVFHRFPYSFDRHIVQFGVKQVVSSRYVVYRLPGSVNGVQGQFEIGGMPGRTLEITHRHFRPWGH